MLKTWVLYLYKGDEMRAIYLHFCEAEDEAMEIFKYECHQNIEEPFYSKIELARAIGSTRETLKSITF